MPRSLAGQIMAAGHAVEDVRDVGLASHPDGEVFRLAAASDAIIVTRDRGFAAEESWPATFASGVILVSLPRDTPAAAINRAVMTLLARRVPESLLGAVTTVERQRALSRRVRRRR
ncbi:MAG: DUF5615 family PIN-like protein [Armatimonadetes bacterium]|nr:DUF5615 family PIN-like protein [Armatimonadota bacterium]